MKDEEMAEEYIEKNCKIWEEGELTVDEIVRLAYLAGLKAGRPQWHVLRKDPNDLPKGHKIVLNQVGARTNYDPDRGFLGLEGCGIRAWMDVPLFEESAEF